MKKPAYSLIPCLLTAAILSACGGGGGSNGTDAANGASTPLVAQPPIQFAGNAPTVSGAAGNVSVLFAPATLTGGSLPQGTTINALTVPLASLVQEPTHGAFTTLASTATATINETGSVYDIAGVGGAFAIGRWTDGSDTSGGTYNKNQGAVYAVGTPLTLSPTATTLACQGLKSTSPATVAGSVAPGTVNSATATLDLNTLTLKNLNINVSIGADQFFVVSGTSDYALNTMTAGAGLTVINRVMGSSSDNPYVAVAYGAHATTSGDFNGLVLLSCTKSS